MLKETLGTLAVAAPAATIVGTSQRYLSRGTDNTEDIRKDLISINLKNSNGRNDEYRKIEGIAKEIKEKSNISKNKVLNEINTLKVAVWEKMKTKESNKNDEVLKENDAFDKEALSSKIVANIKTHPWVHAGFDFTNAI